MQRQPSCQPARRLKHALPAALIAAASGAAWAADDPSPYYIGVTQSITHDSNVYRLSNGASDNYGSTGLVGGFDQPLGRQRFYAAANVRDNYYAREKTLNNVSYGISAGWDWATIEKVSGGVTVDASRSLASYDNSSQAVPSTVRNILNTQQFGARVRWGGDSLLNLDGAYAHSHVSSSETPTSESTQDSVSAGVSYRVGPTLRLGTAVRLSRSVAPNGVQTTPGVFSDNTTDGRNLDLTADWRYSAQTGANGRLSWTRQTSSGSGDRDFSGLTGGLAATYAPTAKLSFSTSLYRDSGINSSFFNLANANAGQPVRGLNENSQTTDSLAFGANYAATAKIGVMAGLDYRRSKVVDQIVVGGAVVGNDHTDRSHSASLGANYAIARNWSLACSLAYVSRDVGGALPYSYTANTASCTAQFTLR
jgi:hypothetical protein